MQQWSSQIIITIRIVLSTVAHQQIAAITVRAITITMIVSVRRSSWKRSKYRKLCRIFMRINRISRIVVATAMPALDAMCVLIAI